MKRDEALRLIKLELQAHVNTLAEDYLEMEDPDEARYVARYREEVEAISTIGGAFRVMCDHSFDVLSAVGLAFKVVLEDPCEGEFNDVPLRYWDT